MSERPRLVSGDAHDDLLVRHVHPAEWTNPEPAPCYNLVVIGGGTAGLVSAAGAAGLGARVALVEVDRLGGDCLNAGCVPSKGLLRSARAWADVRDSGQFGLTVPAGSRVDFPTVMERMRRLRAEISKNDSAERFRNLGVDVFLGAGSFSGPRSLVVGRQTLHFRKAVVATGTRPTVPAIPGLEAAGYLTNETVFAPTDLPRRLAVIGAGPIGCELAQAFARFGAGVILYANHGQILPREDQDAAALIEAELRRDGIELVVDSTIERIEVRGSQRTLTVRLADRRREDVVDEILVAVGRTPNIESLNLSVAGVASDGKHGVQVNDRLQTTNRRIYAAGDVCSRFKFTHAADAMARIVVQNALFFGWKKFSALTIPWCTYTDPEVAHVGLAGRSESGVAVDTFVQKLHDVDRAVLDGETVGFVKVHVRRGTDRIIGATVVARHAGDLIAELTLAMTAGLGLGSIGKTIHPYPTVAEAIRRTADQHQRSKLTPFVKSLFTRWFAWSRR